jgi:putative endonuclease
VYDGGLFLSQALSIERIMFFVYMINSLAVPDRMYVGRTNNLENRLKEHNNGESIHTNKYRPWKLRACVSFDAEDRAIAFEKYLKSGPGRVFAKRHF